MNSQVQHILEAVEAPAFAVDVNVAPSHHHAETIARHSELFGELVELSRQDRTAVTEAVLNRIRRLVALEPDVRYESPWDAALMTYLLVIEHIATEAIDLALGLVTRARNTWWARQTVARLNRAASEPDAASTLTNHVQAFFLGSVVEQYVARDLFTLWQATPGLGATAHLSIDPTRLAGEMNIRIPVEMDKDASGTTTELSDGILGVHGMTPVAALERSRQATGERPTEVVFE
jgi:hypothetical protein